MGITRKQAYFLAIMVSQMKTQLEKLKIRLEKQLARKLKRQAQSPFRKQLKEMEKELYFNNLPSPYLSVPRFREVSPEEMILNAKVRTKARKQLERSGFVA